MNVTFTRLYDGIFRVDVEDTFAFRLQLSLSKDVGLDLISLCCSSFFVRADEDQYVCVGCFSQASHHYPGFMDSRSEWGQRLAAYETWLTVDRTVLAAALLSHELDTRVMNFVEAVLAVPQDAPTSVVERLCEAHSSSASSAPAIS